MVTAKTYDRIVNALYGGMAAFALIWLFMICCPVSWRFDCVGDVVVHNEGQFVAHGNGKPVIYEHEVFYRTSDGTLHVRYYDATFVWRQDYSMLECQRNGWKRVYEFRWWMHPMIYITLSFLSLMVYLKITDKKTKKRICKTVDGKS